MTKAGDKLLEGLHEAVEAHFCDHKYKIPQPRPTLKSRLDRFYCPDCKATLNVPRSAGRPGLQ